MKDFKAIFKTYFGKTKTKIGVKKEFGDKFIHGGYEESSNWYYERMFFSKILPLNFLHNFLSSKKFSNILEIGCSTALLPKFMPEIFQNKEYTGVDLSNASLDVAKKNFVTGDYLQGDFLKLSLDKKFDLILSLDVIDHVYDPDAFLEKIIKNTEKFGVVRAYRGYFDEIDEHVMEYRDNEGIFLNNLSIPKIKTILEKNNIQKFELLKQKSRDKIFYDSDLGRKWKRSSTKEKENIIQFTGFNEETLNSLPVAFETSDHMIKKSKNKITYDFLDLPKSYASISDTEHLLIIFEK